jgi:hypothetical protein
MFNRKYSSVFGIQINYSGRIGNGKMFDLEINNPKILKVIHDPQNFGDSCFECGKFDSIIFLVVEEGRNIFRKEGCMQEVFMCPSCFNFLFVLNPSKRGEPFH